LQQRRSYFEADEVMVSVRRITVLCHLGHVESEFGADVRLRIISVSDLVSILDTKFGEFQSYHLVDHGMASVVGRVMRERSQGESIFVDVGRFTQKGAHEISAAHVMQQVAEVFLAEWIVTHVL